MLLTIQNIQKYFGAELCLRNISCVLDAQDRAGIIGENGAGKTTLIKIITGELYPDDGIVTLAHGATVGYLEQNSVLDPACTVYGEMENAFRSVLDAMDEMKRLERQMAECPDDHMLLERHAQLSAVVDARCVQGGGVRALTAEIPGGGEGDAGLLCVIDAASRVRAVSADGAAGDQQGCAGIVVEAAAVDGVVIQDFTAFHGKYTPVTEPDAAAVMGGTVVMDRSAQEGET